MTLWTWHNRDAASWYAGGRACTGAQDQGVERALFAGLRNEGVQLQILKLGWAGNHKISCDFTHPSQRDSTQSRPSGVLRLGAVRPRKDR
jgi:hypothetical protein